MIPKSSNSPYLNLLNFKITLLLVASGPQHMFWVKLLSERNLYDGNMFGILPERGSQRGNSLRLSTRLLWTWLPEACKLKKRLCHWCFPVNFAKFLRTPFFHRTPLMAASAPSHEYLKFRKSSWKHLWQAPFLVILVVLLQKDYLSTTESDLKILARDSLRNT